jgi:hypothetical protein
MCDGASSSGSKIDDLDRKLHGSMGNNLDFGSEMWKDEPMNRLNSRIRPRSRAVSHVNGNGVSHVRIVDTVRRSAARANYVVTAAESAPCTCPDFCERDHGNE